MLDACRAPGSAPKPDFRQPRWQSSGASAAARGRSSNTALTPQKLLRHAKARSGELLGQRLQPQEVCRRPARLRLPTVVACGRACRTAPPSTFASSGDHREPLCSKTRSRSARYRPMTVMALASAPRRINSRWRRRSTSPGEALGQHRHLAACRAIRCSVERGWPRRCAVPPAKAPTLSASPPAARRDCCDPRRLLAAGRAGRCSAPRAEAARLPARPRHRRGRSVLYRGRPRDAAGAGRIAPYSAAATARPPSAATVSSCPTVSLPNSTGIKAPHSSTTVIVYRKKANAPYRHAARSGMAPASPQRRCARPPRRRHCRGRAVAVGNCSDCR